MKYILKIGLLSVICVSSVLAENPLPSLSDLGKKTEKQSKVERIQFLLKVGQVYVETKDFEAAEDAYNRVLKLDPQNYEALFTMAIVCINLNKSQKAEKMFLELLKNDPDNSQILNNISWLYSTSEDPKFRDGKKALEYARKALVIAPNDYHIWSTLSEAYYVNGEYEKAYRAAEQMARLIALYEKNVTKESIDSFNEQLRKCKRSMDTLKTMKEVDSEQK